MKITIDNVDEITKNFSVTAKKDIEKYLIGEYYITDHRLHADFADTHSLENWAHYHRNITICVIKHGVKYYGGMAVKNPSDATDNKKGIKLAFQRALKSIHIQLPYYNKMSKETKKNLNKLFWDKFLVELNKEE